LAPGTAGSDKNSRFGKDGSPSAPRVCARWLRFKIRMAHLLPGTATPESVVDALKAIAGHPQKKRASFAAGRCVRGTYAASDRAREITKSRSFTRPSRVLARLSVDEGSCPVAGSGLLRGLSFKLGSNGHRSDILLQSAPVHFARTLDQMLAFLKVRMPGPDGKPDMEQIEAFSAANPETLHQANYIAAHPSPASFADVTYWGVHAFPATNAKGETRFIKFKAVPAGGNVTRSQATTKPAGDDLESRISAGDVRFNVMALLDRPGDPTMDVTIRWPNEDSREMVRMGTVVITGLEPDEVCDATIFDPANLAEGIGHPPDEIFAARQASYAISMAKRRRLIQSPG
jgi:catalase